MSLEVGQVLGGKYMIERVIGRGSMGLVYKGRDTKTGASVAIRLILPEFDNESVPAFFEGEAKRVGDLDCDNIARLYNMGFLPTGERCLVGEYVEGEVLKQRIRSVGHMPELAVAQLLIQLLESLSSAHEAGVVHRDLTPLSIFVVPRNGAPDGIKLIDFGISRLQLLTANPESPPAAIVSEIQSFQYLSPEQLNGLREIDPRSNIYTLGVIAYEAITGRLPFEGKDFGDLTFKILQGDPPPVEELAPESSSPFSQLVSKAMARSPNARFQYAEEMYAAISNWAIRAGISKSKLESGVSDWRSPEVPVRSERPVIRSSPIAAFAPAKVASENETLPWGSPSQGSEPREAAASAASLGGAVATTKSPELSFRAEESSGTDFFAQAPSSPLGLAEEDALFAPPPTAPRDELPFVPLDALATNAAVAAEPSSSAEEHSPALVEMPRVEPSPADTSAWNEPASPGDVSVESKPIVSRPAMEPDEEPPPEAQDPSFRRARTILGIGGVAVRPALKSDPNAGVVVRGPDSVERDVPPSAPSAAPAVPYRPRQATEPGIVAPPFETAPVPVASPALAEPAAAATPRAAVPDVVPAVPAMPAPTPASIKAESPAAPVGVTAQKPAPVSPVPQQTQIKKQAAQAAGAPAVSRVSQPASAAVTDAAAMAPMAVAASSAASELDIALDFRRGRSKKPIVVAILLIGLAVAGVAVALLQKSPPPRPGMSSQGPSSTVAPSAIASPAVVPTAESPQPSPSVEIAARGEPKPSPAADVASAARKSSPVPSPSGAGLASSARSASTPSPKPQKPAKAVQGSLPGAQTPPAKPSVNKGAVSKDPYNYR